MTHKSFKVARYKLNSMGRGSAINQESNVSMPIGKLVEEKKNALRRGVWFRSLNRIERGIIDLTIRYVENIKSTKLAKIVTAIIEKLQTATKNRLDRLVRTIGLALAHKLSKIAMSWGNKSARQWANDCSYAKYLVLFTNSIGAKQSW
jgi:hypothetical protein